MNRWGIPKWLEAEVRDRDRTCIYCGIQMQDSPTATGSRRSVGTWEHIINDASIVTRENIARCCAPCNSSKGTKSLAAWLESNYCQRLGINRTTVAQVARRALDNDA
jgi:5-methylcytosine-specific restriction endonuclease McrA